MATFTGGKVYEKLGVSPVINAIGHTTVLGGSTPSTAVIEAMEEAGLDFVVMRELLDKAGEFIAELLGTEAAYPTSGCAAALSLSAAVCMTGGDLARASRLPNTTGMKNEFLIQKPQRYSADPCYRFPGGHVVEAGDAAGCTAGQLHDAVGPHTAAIAYYLQPDWGSSVVSLEDAAAIGKRNGVPVIVDAAYQVYPLDYFRRSAQSADLVCFSAKYYGGPNSAGFVTGRKDLVEAIAAMGFTEAISYTDIPSGPAYAWGRGMKLDRQEVVALLAALDGWLSTDHEDRLGQAQHKMSVIQRRLEGIPHVEAKTVPQESYLGAVLHVVLAAGAGKTAQQVADELDAGDPRIRVLVNSEDTLEIVPHPLKEGQESVVAERLANVLTTG